ncbi:MAG: aspartate kinase [Elusimicrobia bacterium CG11_big_fil_rev_8_21_14_0_20_64_6]|nr:MAG: aspartate kinase [Elusimicrobia bacterium CG11_big_fil_rev_8_21_14_0_20_64_6]
MPPRKITVIKFGGTSVADPEKIQRAAERATGERRKGYGVVVVVSAPGDMTDELIALAERITPKPDERELDQLITTGEQVGISLFAMACRARGIPAVSLTGPQAGIDVVGDASRAQIRRIRSRVILKHLDAGRIVVVAGFQGLAANGDTVTLGRGGSDLTAVALASALKTGRCEIFSDIKGVYTADPRIVHDARKLSHISFEEMLELAGAGAQVMQARSMEVAERFGVELHIRSAFHALPGTKVAAYSKEKLMLEKAFVSSLALDKSEVRLTVVGVPDQPGVAAQVLTALAGGNIPVDMIIQSAPSLSGVNDMSFMTPKAFGVKAKKALEIVAKKLRAQRVDLNDQVAKISAVGTGFRHSPKIAARMFTALADQKINIHMISASDLRVSCIVDLAQGESALKALHKAYGLAKGKR